MDRNPAKIHSVLRSLARNTATPARPSTIHSDVIAAEGHRSEVSVTTIRDYLAALERAFVIDDQWPRTSYRLAVSKEIGRPEILVIPDGPFATFEVWRGEIDPALSAALELRLKIWAQDAVARFAEKVSHALNGHEPPDE